MRIRKLGRDALPARDAVLQVLTRAARDGASAREVGVCADILRTWRTNAATASPLLVRLLEEDSPVYRNLLTHEVHRLRGFIFATLAETSVPDNAIDAVTSALANADVTAVYEFAGAARASAAAGARAAGASRYLLRALGADFADDLISFEKFDSHAPERDYTTPQIEALRALRETGVHDETALRIIREFARNCERLSNRKMVGPEAPDTCAEAERTLATLSLHRKRFVGVNPPLKH
jgi:hypothetical protein